MNEGGDRVAKGKQGTGKVIGPADYLHAGLHAFQNRVTRALSVIEEATEHGKIGVSFSGGKDSTVLLDLIRRVVPDAPAAFFDCGCELQQTYDAVRYYGVTIVKSRMSLLEMCRHGGYWGYEDAADPEAEFDFSEVMVDEPARRFVREQRLQVQAIGLRAHESRGRFMNAKQRGKLYFAEYADIWHLCPLQYWTVNDVWAYIASRNLVYNVAYDIMTQIGVPRADQRISALLGSSAAATGRYAILKQIDIGLWNRLAAEFTKMRIYT